MPNRRAADGRKTTLDQRPRGIIRVAALWPLCRYRHKGHWTGHRSRLSRDQSGRFGSIEYAKEELVAEIASAFVCAELNVRPTVRHSDYLATWADYIGADERAIFRAAAQAAKAAQWIMGQRREVRS